MTPRLEQVPHGCCRSHLSLAELSVHNFMMAIEHVLSVSARITGKLNFVSASIWWWARTFSKLGHGCDWIEALADPQPRTRQSGYTQKPSTELPALKRQSHFKERVKMSGGAYLEVMETRNDPPTLRPSDPPHSLALCSPSIKQISSSGPYLRTILRI